MCISTTGGTSTRETSLDRETHDFHDRHVHVKNEWDMQVDSWLYRIETLWKGLGWKYRYGRHQNKCYNFQKHVLYILILKYVFYFYIYIFLIFIVIQLELYAFSPHPTTPPQLNPPPLPTSTLPLGFVHVSFIVVPVIPSSHCPRPPLPPPPALAILRLFLTSMSLVIFC